MKKRNSYILICLLIISCLVTKFAYPAEWSFLGVSDTHNGDGLQIMLEWASTNLLAPAPAFLIHAGDLENVARTEQIVITYFDKPFFPSMGNHDKDPGRQYFYESFYLNKKLPYLVDSTFIKEEGAEALCYSFVYENAYFIVLDQYYRVPYRNYGNVIGKQLQWLEHQLVNNNYPYVFVIGHEPAYPRGWQRNYGDCLDRYPEDRDRFWALLSQYQVTAYLTGHTHSYLVQYLQDVWHIDMGKCLETDYHNKFIHFVVTDDSVQVNVCYLDGERHDRFIVMPRIHVIPVEISLFSYEKIDKGINLIWQTASETNNFGFEIQKSPDQIHFNRIGFVAGNGTTQKPQQYQFTDKIVSSGTYYYRLKQLDDDGKFKLSNILEVTLSSIADFRLMQNFPNPFNQETMIQYQIDSDGLVTLDIYNISGQLIQKIVSRHQTAGIYQVIWNGIDAQGKILPGGLYVCRLTKGREQVISKMLLVR